MQIDVKASDVEESSDEDEVEEFAASRALEMMFTAISP